MKAVCLLSGGLDSSTCLAVARRDGFDCYALSFDYGQRHKVEVEVARKVAGALSAKQHVTIPIDLRVFGGSALTATSRCRKAAARRDGARDSGQPYVPARNTVFLSFALAWAETLGGGDIFIGVNAIDYSGYPDCRPEYIEAYETMANLATRAGVEGAMRVRIHTPLIHLSKAGIVRLAAELAIDLR